MQRAFLNVGYLLSEAQIRSYFDRFGNLSDLYLPKHVKGRNKGYGFVTFASQDTLETVLAQPHHVVDGISVQVQRAGPRPSEPFKADKSPSKGNTLEPQFPTQAPAVMSPSGYGHGPRLYVGGLHSTITATSVQNHFAQWGAVLDVYFPGAKWHRHQRYCFVTFDSSISAQRACDRSPRFIDGMAIKAISIAEDRKCHTAQVAAQASLSGTHSAPPMCPLSVQSEATRNAESLQLQYQSQLSALEVTMSKMSGYEAAISASRIPAVHETQFQPAAYGSGSLHSFPSFGNYSLSSSMEPPSFHDSFHDNSGYDQNGLELQLPGLTMADLDTYTAKHMDSVPEHAYDIPSTGTEPQGSHKHQAMVYAAGEALRKSAKMDFQDFGNYAAAEAPRWFADQRAMSLEAFI